MKYINKILNIFFKNKNKVEGTPYWIRNLIMCPSQCYCNFEGDDKKYCIYLRWRWDDPWTAYIVPCYDDWDFIYGDDWKELNVGMYTHDDYNSLEKECEKIIRKMFNCIKFTDV